MRQEEIVNRLSYIFYPTEIIHEITTEDLIAAIVKRYGEKALELSVEDLKLARDEVKAAFDHHLDEREFIEIGLDIFEQTRNL